MLCGAFFCISDSLRREGKPSAGGEQKGAYAHRFFVSTQFRRPAKPLWKGVEKRISLFSFCGKLKIKIYIIPYF